MSPYDAPPNPDAPIEPVTAEDFIRRGWILHVKGDLQQAEADFRQALAQEPKSVEGLYALGLSLKLQGRSQEALESFRQAIAEVGAGSMEDPARATMLRHLADWHIKTLQAGLGEEPRP